MKWRHLMIVAIAAACFPGLFKPAVIRTERDTRLAVLLRWQSGQIQFVNSVTGRPVTIGFHIGRRFQAFSVLTDETTEEYYTNGLYDMNATVAKESTDRLSFCSVKGISLRLGFYTFSVKDECLEVALLWTVW
jgi:hypothetical protein